ncbi:hypothetical protein SUGI_0024880 [Cryptomeria japonica]|nr:hypothetical protein SUGI_0024880 [Cryptomeria japonica]
MDLITTGVLANERIRRANLVSSVRILIMEKMQVGGPSTRKIGLLEEMHKQGSKEVNLNGIHNAIGNLVSEGFDLIYLVLDKADEQTDRRLARNLVALHYHDELEDKTLDALDLPTLTSYIIYARQHIHRKIADEAAEEF